MVVTAALELQDPRERPRTAEAKADQAHRRFRDERSDFVSLLRLWAFLSEARARGTSHLKRTCQENFISFVRAREWFEVHRQLQDVVREIGLVASARMGSNGPRRQRRPRGARSEPSGEQGVGTKAGAEGGMEVDGLHKALLSGLLSRIGQYQATARVYAGARQTRFLLHPASALAKKPPAWVMAYELVQTTQLFARTAAKIQPEWLNDVAAHLLKRRYGEPYWSSKAARAHIKEQATLFGLPVLRDHDVDYSKVAPGRARLIFLEHALVRGEYRSRGRFQAKNEQLLDYVARLRDKARQSSMLADDEALLTFFDGRVPEHVVDGRSFETWRETAEVDNPDLLLLSLSDVLVDDRALDPADYPDTLTLHGTQLELTYRFEPTADDDGVSVILPLPMLLHLDAGELDWTIPAWHHDKIYALLETLPKDVRRRLGPLPALARELAARLTPFSGPMLPLLSAATSTLSGVEVEAAAFRMDAVAPHLRLTIRLVDERGHVIAQHRDLRWLMGQHLEQARSLFKQAVREPNWERKDLSSWDFDELPSFVERSVYGARVRAYPTLLARDTGVDLTLMESEQEALVALRGGLRRLISLEHQRALAALGKRVPPPFPRTLGLPPSRAAKDAFRARVLDRVVDEAFELETERLPRTRTAYESLRTRGASRLESALVRWSTAITAAASELERTLRALVGVL